MDYKGHIEHEKLRKAEYNIALMRFLVVLGNSIIYLLYFTRFDEEYHWLAFSIIGIANLYSFYFFFAKPYEKFHLLTSSMYSSVLDCFLITSWLLATGGVESEFFLLWYVSIFAVAYRFSANETLLAALFYSASYVFLYLMTGSVIIGPFEMIVRVFYIFIAAGIGFLVSNELYRQIESKYQLKVSEETRFKKEEEVLQLNKTLEEKVLEQTSELSSMNARLKTTLDEMEKFSFIASHDLKVPIYNIKSLLSLIQYEKVDEENKEILNQMEDAIQHGEGIIKSLLSFVDDGFKISDNPEKINVDAALNHIQSSLAIFLENHQASIKIIGDTKSEINTNPKEFNSIFRNLISNSVKYAHPDRKAEIAIEIIDTQDYIEINFTDNGIGIDLEKHSSKLFNLGARLHTLTNIEGAGLGLYLVRKLIIKNNGTITVSSVLNKGTTFKIKFYR